MYESDPPLRELIERGYTVVTAGARQAAYLRHDFAAAMTRSGKTAWETPDVLPWQAWLRRSFDAPPASSPGPRLLNPAQQRQLWRDIIRGSPAGGALLQVEPVIDQALRAYALCKAWQIPIFPGGIALNRDAAAFRSWYRAYSDLLSGRQWLDEAGLPDALVDAGYRPATAGLVWYGFDVTTPQQGRLLDGLRERGLEVVTHRQRGRNRATRCLPAPDCRAEIRAAAFWARQIINRDPAARVGVIVPELESLREQVIGIFDDCFHPGAVLAAVEPDARHYSVAPGRALSSYPVIHTALAILSLGNRRHTLEDIAALLRSPFMRDAAGERAARMRYLAALHRTGEYEWRLGSLIRYSRGVLEERDRPGVFIGLLEALERDRQGIARTLNPGLWAQAFDRWLGLFGWPGDRPPDSAEYQTLVAWKDVLNRFTTLGGVMETSDYAGALAAVSDIAAEMSFQPETPETPVQVTGLPGAAGMHFDYLWVTGLHDQAWPPPARPNPFIPRALQVGAGIPGSSAALSLAHAGALTEALAASAGEVILSHPRRDGDRECRPSPVLREVPLLSTASWAGEMTSYKQSILASAVTETVMDDRAPAVAGDESPGGGAGVFRDQAACPFRAYARHRLRAEDPGGVDIGLDPRVRGMLAHATMQYLWQELQSADRLRQLPETRIREIITAVVDRVIRRHAVLQPESFDGRFRELESRRLAEMAAAWLAIERDREPFIVRELEMRHVTTFNGLTLRLRIDRVDELGDGRLAIIDYKTGRTSLAAWDGDRPDDPQLPLYAVCGPGRVAAIAYAGLRQGDYRFTGLSAGADLLPGVAPARDRDTGRDHWQEQLGAWQTVLERLAAEFLEGRAEVDPKSASTCRYCDLHTLCRVHEMAAMDDDSEERGARSEE